ncbi:thyrotroph embryonic factor-like isoform X1 [Cloeon dipterum]|uniref:thyrotroph embryonic factor-like isoform X1 n=2 Tax=Cloeon dipterum TaxID=197152 RepID=UPI00321F929C
MSWNSGASKQQVCWRMEEVPDIRHQLNQLAQLLMMDSTLPSVDSIHQQQHGKFGDKCKDDVTDEWSNFEAQAAFLGPNIWEKGAGLGNDIQLGDQYVDLDEFLNSTCISSGNQQQSRAETPDESLDGRQSSASMQSEDSAKPEEEQDDKEESVKDEELSEPPSPAQSTSSNDSDDSYHPPPSKRSRRANVDYRKKLSNVDLKPAPVVKKSRKQFVPDDLKDDKYWARRRKNNLAAKRSRDARRAKENQIVVRAGYLEDENTALKEENEKLKNENKKLRAELAKYNKKM